MRSASDFHLDRFSMFGVTLARFVPRICVKPWIFYLRSVRGGGARVKESASHHEMKPQNTNNTLKVESALLLWLGLPGSISMSIFMFCVFCDFYKVKVSQSHCFWVLAPSWTFPNWFRTHLEFFMKTCFLRFPGSFWRHFGKYFEEVPNENSSCLTWNFFHVIKNNVFKTWGLPPIFIWIDFQCLALLWRALFHEFALNPESSTFGQSGGGEGEGECFAPWNETTKHKQYIESRKCIAFCAPGFYRGQFLC